MVHVQPFSNFAIPFHTLFVPNAVSVQIKVRAEGIIHPVVQWVVSMSRDPFFQHVNKIVFENKVVTEGSTGADINHLCCVAFTGGSSVAPLTYVKGKGVSGSIGLYTNIWVG